MEPRDINRLIEDIQIRFKSSTTENLDNLTKFTVTSDENPERMFARFNIIAKPLEDERPRVITVDHLKTSYLHHFKQLLTIEHIRRLPGIFATQSATAN